MRLVPDVAGALIAAACMVFLAGTAHAACPRDCRATMAGEFVACRTACATGATGRACRHDCRASRRTDLARCSRTPAAAPPDCGRPTTTTPAPTTTSSTDDSAPQSTTTSPDTSTTTSSDPFAPTPTTVTTSTVSLPLPSTTTSTVPLTCGNGVLDPGEECDGGPLCSPTCRQRLESCCQYEADCAPAPVFSLLTYLADWCGTSSSA